MCCSLRLLESNLKNPCSSTTYIIIIMYLINSNLYGVFYQVAPLIEKPGVATV